MTNVCRVHGSTSECVSSQFAKLKIAVALVVIRDKPAGQNVKDFVNNLISFHQDKVGSFCNELILKALYCLFFICIFEWQNKQLYIFLLKDQRWKAEYHRLKQEVLQLRQQQLLFAINSRLNSQSSGKTRVIIKFDKVCFHYQYGSWMNFFLKSRLVWFSILHM